MPTIHIAKKAGPKVFAPGKLFIRSILLKNVKHSLEKNGLNPEQDEDLLKIISRSGAVGSSSGS